MNPDEENEKNSQKERRSFLKKALYSAPVITVLGELVRPTKAQAFPYPGGESLPPPGPI